MIFIIGVDHYVQWVPERPNAVRAALTEDFSKFLTQEALQSGASIMAEEFSTQAVINSGLTCGGARSVKARDE